MRVAQPSHTTEEYNSFFLRLPLGSSATEASTCCGLVLNLVEDNILGRPCIHASRNPTDLVLVASRIVLAMVRYRLMRFAFFRAGGSDTRIITESISSSGIHGLATTASSS